MFHAKAKQNSNTLSEGYPASLSWSHSVNMLSYGRTQLRCVTSSAGVPAPFTGLSKGTFCVLHRGQTYCLRASQHF